MEKGQFILAGGKGLICPTYTDTSWFYPVRQLRGHARSINNLTGKRMFLLARIPPESLFAA